MKRVFRISKAAGFFAALATVALAVLGALDVFLTMVFNSPITGTIELSRVLLACLLFLGMASAVETRHNVSVDILLNALSQRHRRKIALCNQICTLAFYVILALLGWKLALNSWETGDVLEGAIQIRLWPFKAMAAFGVSLAVLAQIDLILEDLKSIEESG